MVVIRLARHGAKKKPFYHVVAADSRAPRDGLCLEKLGFFNPMTRNSELRCKIDLERFNYWAGVGAQATDRVKSLIREQKKLQTQAELN